ncbi:hypothetical protein TCAL_07638 [Tigriopus californicus]|uniref:Cytochrome b5 heme-binding domain-containing protein n=1 Tax=Tigriopus californicus TaxID=6832 RepID=A0A553NVW2_TIGCA|nr:uncharacterized protein LOC131880428 [Tigriopus californicus]TRY69572.1 hypothetical protein TCAL_07638 [Tigriopus californicus]|eukprot:TCALIF_07638-PA protein Name:"Similar to Cyt-b5 Cytochrome b5 (Drosophila melanogaster)" AED:0.30 eAED:0.30 QI:0/0/0/0.5/1/1/2/0/234
MAFWNPAQLKSLFGFLAQNNLPKKEEPALREEMAPKASGGKVASRVMASSALRLAANALSRANSQISEEISVGDVLECLGTLEEKKNCKSPGVELGTRPRALVRQETTNSIEDGVHSAASTPETSSSTLCEDARAFEEECDETGLPIIDYSEVQEHDSPEDGWMVFYNKVYDVTDFLNQHPGGSFVMHEYLGRDATSAFSGHSSDAYEIMDDYMIGVLPKHQHSNIYSIPMFLN